MPTDLLIPLWIKILYTAFVAVLIPVYWKNYGPTNFLFFCDVAALLTLLGAWMENSLILSAVLVGSFLPQMLWVIDFFAELSGRRFTGLTSYMFDSRISFFLRFLSFYHFWLVFLIIYLVWCVGYSEWGLLGWCWASFLLVTVSYVHLPGPGSFPNDPKIPVNINYVYGFNADRPQTMMSADLYLAAYMFLGVFLIFVPTHYLFVWLIPGPR